jgi:hypothetical protein
MQSLPPLIFSPQFVSIFMFVTLSCPWVLDGDQLGAKQPRSYGEPVEAMKSISLNSPVPLRAGKLTTDGGCHIAFSTARTVCPAYPATSGP